MSIDYVEADKTFSISFEKLNRPTSKLDFPPMGALSECLSRILTDNSGSMSIGHKHSCMLASSSVEMWHRAIHSFICSVGFTQSSPLWASNCGYYASHFIMRAFAHSLGFFKSFKKRCGVQIIVQRGQFVCVDLDSKIGEHGFYWKVVKEHPNFISNPLFRENQERENNRDRDKSDVVHRNYATYADHLNQFDSVGFLDSKAIIDRIDRIGKYPLYSVEAPTPQRGVFPDMLNVQILAFQRIVAFHDYLDDRVSNNKFWKAHRRPTWCNKIVTFHVNKVGLEQPDSI